LAIDAIEAVRSVLLEDAALADLTTYIYGAEFPDDEAMNMPRKCVVLAGAGGLQDNGTVDIVKPRIDIYSYGETYKQAGRVDRAIYDVLKHLARKTINGVLLHSVACGSGPYQVKHAGTGWPAVWRSYQVTAADIETE